MYKKLDIIQVSDIFKNKVTIHLPFKYVIGAVKIEVFNPFLNDVNLDLYKVEIRKLIPGKIYKNLCLKVYCVDGNIFEFYIDEFKTKDGNKFEMLLLNFYEKFMGSKIGESKFNYWNNSINLGKKTFNEFCHHVLIINRFCIKNLSDMEFLSTVYRLLVNDVLDDLFYFWVSYFELRLKGLNSLQKRREFFKKILEEYRDSIYNEGSIYLLN